MSTTDNVVDLPTGVSAQADDALSAADAEAIAAVNESPDTDDLGEQGGKSIEDLADDIEDEDGQRMLDFGTDLNLKIGGKKPTQSRLKIAAISTQISGQIGAGSDDELYAFVVVGQLRKMTIEWMRGEDRTTTAKSRDHVLKPISVTRISDEEAQALIEGRQAEL